MPIENKPASKVELNKICAVMCNYKRPKNARKCVKQLKRLGITEVIVWNNGAKPIPEATKNINRSHNIGPIGKYLAGLSTTKPYILVTDDDYLITKAGLDAMRKYVLKYPVVAQNGDIYSHFNAKTGSRKRTRYHSEDIKTPKRVDLVIPNRGLMLSTNLYKQIHTHWAWGALQKIRRGPGFFFTDQAMNCAVWDITKKHPYVVPVKGKGAIHLPEETRGAALSKHKGRYPEFVKIWRWLIKHGWSFLKIKPKT